MSDLVGNPEDRFSRVAAPLLQCRRYIARIKYIMTFSWSRGSQNLVIYEPPRGKTNNVVSEHVRHKPVCTSTEKS